VGIPVAPISSVYSELCGLILASSLALFKIMSCSLLEFPFKSFGDFFTLELLLETFEGLHSQLSSPNSRL
jgi:hypothetical protein